MPQNQPLTVEQIRQDIRILDEELNRYWNLGKNIVLGWCPTDSGLLALVVPHYFLPDIAQQRFHLLYGRREMSPRQFERVAIMFNTAGVAVGLPHVDWDRPTLARAVEPVLHRYSVTRTEFRAGILFDIVDLASKTAVDQVTQLNSLSYAVNVAQSRLQQAGIDVDLARTSTPTGLIVWNRLEGLRADVNLYCLMALALAENALARAKGDRHTAPELRACFDIAHTYDYHQPQGLSPTIQSCITGELTRRLGVMRGAARPGQILIGHFQRPNSDLPVEPNVLYKMTDVARFLALADRSLSQLNSLQLSGDRIASIKAYLTGEQIEGGFFSIKQYSVSDEFGTKATVFNAKVNIERDSGKPVYLGRQNKELDGYGFEAVPFDVAAPSKDFIVRLNEAA
jgi:hypothetical protein